MDLDQVEDDAPVNRPESIDDILVTGEADTKGMQEKLFSRNMQKIDTIVKQKIAVTMAAKVREQVEKEKKVADRLQNG